MKEKNNLKRKIFYKENKAISWMNNKMKEKNKKMVRNANIIIIYLNFFFTNDIFLNYVNVHYKVKEKMDLIFLLLVNVT